MTNKLVKQAFCGGICLRSMALAIPIFLSSGCAINPSEKIAEVEVVAPSPMPPLSYYQMLSRLTSAELGRERMVLAALPRLPNTQLRLAMLLGYPRAQQDLARAMIQLDAVLKSTDLAAIELHPLARMLADNYAERQKMDAHLDRQGLQLKESQRKAAELQQKIEGLADIERTLPQRPRAIRPAKPGSVR